MRKEISLETIERWLKDSNCDVREAAMNACQGKDVPLEIIERWLKDSNWYVRKAAMNACQFLHLFREESQNLRANFDGFVVSSHLTL